MEDKKKLLLPRLKHNTSDTHWKSMSSEMYFVHYIHVFKLGPSYKTALNVLSLININFVYGNATYYRIIQLNQGASRNKAEEIK